MSQRGTKIFMTHQEQFAPFCNASKKAGISDVHLLGLCPKNGHGGEATQERLFRNQEWSDEHDNYGPVFLDRRTKKVLVYLEHIDH